MVKIELRFLKSHEHKGDKIRAGETRGVEERYVSRLVSQGIAEKVIATRRVKPLSIDDNVMGDSDESSGTE